MKKNTVITAGVATAAAAGLALGGAVLARADQSSTSVVGTAATPTATSTSSAMPGVDKDGDKAGREANRLARLLSGDTAVKVTQAATTKEPTAKLVFVGSNPAGGYLARMVRTDGTHLLLKIDASFRVTSDQLAPTPMHREDRMRRHAPGTRAPGTTPQTPGGTTPGQAPTPSGSPTSASVPAA